MSSLALGKYGSRRKGGSLERHHLHDPRDFFLLPQHTDASVVDRKEIMLPLTWTLTEEEFPGNAWSLVCGRNLELHKVH
jgi:hypothetical protein